jgi:hypothetical protein
LSITFPMVRNAVKPLDLSEIRGGVRNMGILRYVGNETDEEQFLVSFQKLQKSFFINCNDIFKCLFPSI